MPEYTFGQLISTWDSESNCSACDGKVEMKSFYVPKGIVTDFDRAFPNPIHFEYNGSIVIGVCKSCGRITMSIVINEEFN